MPVQQEYFEQYQDILQFYTGNPSKGLDDTALEVVASILRHGPSEEAERIVPGLWPYRDRVFTNVRAVMSRLDGDGFIQNLLLLEGGRPAEKPAAALFFRDSPRAPERIVPLLMMNLTPAESGNLLQNVCNALAAYGTNATPALPQLTNLLTHPKPLVRQAASNAIARIEE